MSQAGLGNEKGIRSAYQAHGPELYRFALRQLRDASLAEEAVQETFVRAWKASSRFDPRLAGLRTWLFAICRNVVIDILRSRGRRKEEPASELPEANGFGSDHLESLLEAWQVEEALRRISSEHRQALIETYFRRRPYREVAGELGIPEGTLRSRVFYALKSLRLALEEMGWEP